MRKTTHFARKEMCFAKKVTHLERQQLERKRLRKAIGVDRSLSHREREIVSLAEHEQV